MEKNTEFDNKNNLLTKEDVERYCRQIILPEIGTEGQLNIKDSKVLVVGAGGLGSPCLLYLAGAGVGEIGIIDGDSVDNSNLHRQIIHSTTNKGINKAKSAAMLIMSFNPLVKINVYEEHLCNENALEICKEYDVIVDCCDNPATRYLTSDISVVLNKPLVSGSAVKWEGQLTIYTKDSIHPKNYNSLPCYRCLFPIPTPSSAVCNCAEAGVFGPVPGVIGTLQANETVKLIINKCDKLLAKKMLMYDAYDMIFKIFKLRNKKDDCIACGKNPQINKDNIQDYDYNEFVNPKECFIPKRVEIPMNNNIKWKDLYKKINDNINSNMSFVDVRPIEQFNMFKINDDKFNFKNVPWKNLKENFNLLKKELFTENEEKEGNEIYVMCRAGNNSTHAVKFLLEKGYTNVFNIEDGIHGYIKEIDSKNTPFY